MIGRGWRVHPVEGHGVALLSRMDAACHTFGMVPEIVDSIVVFIDIGGVEMVLVDWVIGAPQRDKVLEMVERVWSERESMSMTGYLMGMIRATLPFPQRV
jgi:hypothetical protein